MRNNIRDDILNTASVLFGKKNYNSVSIKNIADTLGISTGNLTYHFKRKEDIALELVLQMYDSYKKMAVPNDLSQLYKYIKHLVYIQDQHTYYFKHYVQFSQISPKIKQIQQEIYQDISDILTTSFQILYENQIICDDQFPEQRKLVIETIMVLCISGYNNETINRFACIWNTFLPLLSTYGRIVYEQGLCNESEKMENCYCTPN